MYVSMYVHPGEMRENETVRQVRPTLDETKFRKLSISNEEIRMLFEKLCYMLYARLVDVKLDSLANLSRSKLSPPKRRSPSDEIPT